MGFVRFMSSHTGRATRVVAGLALIGLGVVLGDWWLLLSAVGLVPLAAGVFDFCLFGPLFRAPFQGRQARELSQKAGN